MKQLKVSLAVALVALVAAGTIGLAQEKQETPRIKITGKPEGSKVVLKQADAEEQQSELAEKEAIPRERPVRPAWLPLDMPGEAHKFFEQMVGAWEVKLKVYQAPDAEPLTGRGDMSRKMVLGGRFLMTTYKGEFVGETFLGFGYDGYDNHKKKYVSSWIDNNSTALYYSEGELDETGKILTQYGESVDPETGKLKKLKSELSIRSLSMHKLVSYEMNEEDEWVKTMEALFGKL
jgi:hypothetical protein